MVYVDRLVSTDLLKNIVGSVDSRLAKNVLNRVVYKEFSESLIEVSGVDVGTLGDGMCTIRYCSTELGYDHLEYLVSYVDRLLLSDKEKVIGGECI